MWIPLQLAEAEADAERKTAEADKMREYEHDREEKVGAKADKMSKMIDANRSELPTDELGMKEHLQLSCFCSCSGLGMPICLFHILPVEFLLCFGLRDIAMIARPYSCYP